MDEDVLQDVSAEDFDKVTEYFRLKKVKKTLSRDVKDLKVQHPNYDEAERLAKKLKELRDEIKENTQIKEITEKLSGVKERMDLMKEMIRIDLIENAQEEITKSDEDKKLKLIYVLKEVKAQGEKKAKPQFKPQL